MNNTPTQPKQPKQTKQRSISQRFSYALISIVTFMLVGFATISIFANISRMNTKLTNQLENTLKLAETSLVTPLWNFDVNSVEDFVDALFHDETIVYVKVLADTDVTAVRVQTKFNKYEFTDFELSSQFLAKTSYIMHQGKKIGSIQLVLSRKSVQQESLTHMFAIIALTLFIIAAIALTSMVITRRYISKPLLQLQHSATRITNGDLEAAIDSSSRDEIGSLAQNLNAMRESIKALFDALHESSAKTEESNRFLRDREARIRAIVETAADGIITIDENGIVESFNPAAEKMFSYSAEEVIGSNISILMPPPDWKTHVGDQTRYWKTVDGKIDDGIREVIGQKKNGTTFSMDLAVSEVLLGDKLLFTAIVHDITERKRTEQILSNYNRTLEDEVTQRTQELSNAIEDLKTTQSQLVEAEKMASLGGLVAGVAHEINTPIGIGLTLASLLKDDTVKLLDLSKNNNMKRSDLNKYLDKADQGSTMLLSNLNLAAELIQSFKQVAVDQTNEEKRTFILKSYIEEILLSLQPKIKRTHHSIVINGDKKLSLNSFPGVFSQIITNLIMNTLIHAYEPDDHGCINIDLKKQDNNLIFEYRDDGKGISVENLSKIFDPFFTTNRGKGGSGLGLHIIYNLVTQKLNGTIRCESKVGVSTSFIVTIPNCYD